MSVSSLLPKDTLPVLPLKGNVAYPNSPFRYDGVSNISIISFLDTLTDDKRVILVGQRNLDSKDLEAHDLFEIGVIARVSKVINNPDYSKSIIFDCHERVNLYQISVSQDVITAKYTYSPLQEDDNFDEAEFIVKIKNTLKKAHSLHIDEFRVASDAISSMKPISKAAYYIADLLISNSLNRQALLEINYLNDLLDTLNHFLNEEIEFLLLSRDLEKQVHENMENNQREYYLREQLHAIQDELGTDENAELADYAKKIDSLDMGEEVKEKLKKELSRLEKMPYGSPDVSVIRNYLDTALDLPWGVFSSTDVDVKKAKVQLEKDHYGLEKIKERILEYIAVKKIAPNGSTPILCLIGPPGVGKTSVAYSIAKAMNREAVRISLGGVKDESDIRGHRKTYVGAMPGRIVDGISHSKTMNPVMILDEIDKLGHTQLGDPASALLEVLDSEQNKTFRDHYLEFPLDLSQCIFIATANDYSGIPAPLFDRMEIIELTSYTDVEKYHIANNHLIPKQRDLHGLNKSNLSIPKRMIEEIIKSYVKEAGVRDLERKIATICRKAALKLVTGESDTITLSKDNLKEFLGNPRYYDDNLNKVNRIGVVNGLAYTSVGGAVLNVQVLVNEGSGKVELTGSLGAVMKESASIAISYIRSISNKLNIEHDFYKTKDIHIHFPDGATPKDGPSAGITMTCAIISALSRVEVSHKIAMTGEITLTGQILPIGGLKEKTMAAYKNKIDTLLIPKDNEKDLDDIDKTARANLKFVLCETLFDALPYVFGDVKKVLK